MADKEWVIIGATNPDPIHDTFEVVYYSSMAGWTGELGMATLFDDDEKKHCALPQGGQWLEIGGILNG